MEYPVLPRRLPAQVPFADLAVEGPVVVKYAQAKSQSGLFDTLLHENKFK